LQFCARVDMLVGIDRVIKRPLPLNSDIMCKRSRAVLVRNRVLPIWKNRCYNVVKSDMYSSSDEEDLQCLDGGKMLKYEVMLACAEEGIQAMNKLLKLHQKLLCELDLLLQQRT